MSKDNGNGKTLRTGIILNLDAKLTEILEKQGETHGEIKALRIELEQSNEDHNKLNKDFKAHLEEHQKNPGSMILSPIIKKLGWKGCVRVLGISAASLLLLAFLLMFVIEKLGLGKTLGLLN